MSIEPLGTENIYHCQWEKRSFLSDKQRRQTHRSTVNKATTTVYQQWSRRHILRIKDDLYHLLQRPQNDGMYLLWEMGQVLPVKSRHYRSKYQYEKDDNYCKKGDLITIRTMTVIGVKNALERMTTIGTQISMRRTTSVGLKITKSPVRKTSSTERDDMSI